MDSLDSQLELLLRQIETGAADSSSGSSARKLICQILRRELAITDAIGYSIADLLEAAIHTPQKTRRIALLVLRWIAVPRVLPENDDANQIERKTVSLIESSLPDICKDFQISGLRQTRDKYISLRRIHFDI